jgi:hypothetical protein
MRILLLLLALTACYPAFPEQTVNPRLSNQEAETALTSYLLREISSMPLHNLQEVWKDMVGGATITAYYEGNQKWIINGPGVVRTTAGGFESADGKWLLDERGLRITPINSEASTMRDLLERSKELYPTSTPSPTLTRTPRPTSTPVVTGCPQISDFRGEVSRLGVQVWSKITNTCQATVSIDYAAVAYDASQEIVAVGVDQQIKRLVLGPKEARFVTAGVTTSRGSEVTSAYLLITNVSLE